MASETQQSASQLERGLRVLLYIADAGVATVPATAAAVGVPVSSTYRHVRTLKELGFIREESPGHYSIGNAGLGLMGRHTNHARLVESAPAVLTEVLAATGETAVLNVRVGSRAMCLCRAEPMKSIKYTFGINELLPLHAGAPQRVLLAWAPSGVIEQVVNGPLPAYSDATLNRDELVRSLAETRRHGFTISRGELDAGAVSVAVPVRHDGEVVCALNTAGPAETCVNGTWIRRARLALQAAAEALSLELGSLGEDALMRSRALRD